MKGMFTLAFQPSFNPLGLKRFYKRSSGPLVLLRCK